ncbi:MAG: Aldehyde dehydrogenase, partial [uncultured Solirubrobacteraceae bacterium]
DHRRASDRELGRQHGSQRGSDADRGGEPGHRRGHRARARVQSRRGRRDGAPRPRGAARLGRAGLRGPFARAVAHAEVDDRQRRAHHRGRRVRDGQGLRGRPARGLGLRRRRGRLLGEERRAVPRRREDLHRVALRAGQEARPAPLPARPRGGHRPVELSHHELLRRLHPRAGGGQRGDPQAVGGHAAHVAAAARRAARMRHAGGCAAGGHGLRRYGRCADRPRRHDHVHRLDGDREARHEQGGRDAHARLDGARRQGPDARAGGRRRGPRREPGRHVLHVQRRADLHLGRARLRRGARLRRVRREGHREGGRAAQRRLDGAGHRGRRRYDAAQAGRRRRAPRRGRQGEGRQGGRGRSPRARRAGRLLVRADGARRRRPHDGLHDRGDVRAHLADHEGRRRRGGHPPGQRLALRPVGQRGLQGSRQGRGGRAAPGGRHGLGQRRAGQLPRARAADGRGEGVGDGHAARQGRHQEVLPAPVDPGDAVRAEQRAAHVPVQEAGDPGHAEGDPPHLRAREARL